MTTVVVLCGGLGTRLRGIVADRPKVLAPVGGTPFLDHLLAHLRRQGYRDVILSTGYLGEQVAAFVEDGARWDLRVRCVREPAPLGTGGALRFAADEAGLAAPFLALNGDTFFSGDLSRLEAFHRERAAVASLALVRVEKAMRYGTVEVEEESGAVAAFREKEAGREGPAWINAGAYVLGPALLAAISPGRNVSLERDVFPRWIGRGLFARPFPAATFLDIGTPQDFARAEALLQRRP